MLETFFRVAIQSNRGFKAWLDSWKKQPTEGDRWVAESMERARKKESGQDRVDQLQVELDKAYREGDMTKYNSLLILLNNAQEKVEEYYRKHPGEKPNPKPKT